MCYWKVRSKLGDTLLTLRDFTEAYFVLIASSTVSDEFTFIHLYDASGAFIELWITF